MVAIRWRRIVGSMSASASLVLSLAPPLAAQVTTRVSVSTAGVQQNGSTNYPPDISANGRFVVFTSESNNLVAGDTNSMQDVFVRDRQLGTTVRVSVTSAGAQANGISTWPAISADGRYVAFASDAPDLVVGDTNDTWDVFVHDLQTGATERVSVDSSGAETVLGGAMPSISADGRFVAFESSSAYVAGDTNGASDIYVRDRLLGTTERVSVDSSGNQGDSGSYLASISADGRYVAFESYATNLVAGDANGRDDAFVHDRQTGATERASVDSSGAEGNGDSQWVAISGDGNFVAFESTATNLVAGDTNGVRDVFVRDRQSGSTERASVDGSGTQANGASYVPSLSADGRYVAFTSDATNLVAGDTNGQSDDFVRDRATGTNERLSVSSSGAQAIFGSYSGTISGDGRFFVFWSGATNLVAGDTNFESDAFVRDRRATSFTSLCDPGVAGVIACPCGNPPGGSGRGCNNSAGTGGAILTATGVAYLSMDSLAFTTSGEKPTATSVLLQGTSSPASGAVYGQGVRCVGGTLKRLFTKAASGGSITAPNFGAGDPTVSARSAAKGNPISAGQSRWYLVFYRDPIVLGGCPSASTFNATQSGVIAWSL